MINIEQYKPKSNITKEILRTNNFKYIDGYYSYRFPVYKYKKEPTLWCNIYINLESNCCSFNVTDTNFKTYPAFFNREYGGLNKVVETIERKIRTQLNNFIKSEILIKSKNKKKKKGDV